MMSPSPPPPKPAWEPGKRIVVMIQVKLVAPEWLSVIAHPYEPDSETTCCRLISSKVTWLTCKAGNMVMLRRKDQTEWRKYKIESVTLHRVFPTAFNGTVVESAQAWLDGQ